MTDNKKYIINIGDHSETWDADMYAQKGDALYAKYKDANVFEVEDVEDFDEDPANHQYVINIGDHSEVWDSDMVKEKGSKLKAAYPDAVLQRVTWKDYWGEQAALNRERKAELMRPDMERNARLAEIGYYDDLSGEAFTYEQTEGGVPQYGPGIGLKPLSSVVSQSPVTGATTYSDPVVENFFADDTYADRQAEIARLDAEYEENPSVIAEREWRAQVAKEQAEYDDKLLESILTAKEKVDGSKAEMGALSKRTIDPTGANMTMQAIRMLKGENVAQDLVENERMERYNTAQKLVEKAMQAREVAGKGFWGAMGDVGKNKLRDLASQSDTEAYNEIGRILTNLSKVLEQEGKDLSAENLTEDVFDKYLSEDEKLLLLSFYEYNSAMAEAKHDMSGWYKGGMIAAESVQFMLEFLATGGLYKAAGSAATKGLAGALKRWVVKAAKGSVKRILRKGAALMLKNGVYALAGTAARTLVAPTTYKNMAERSVEIEGGELHKAKNMAIGFFDSYVENLSEVSGGMIGKALGIPFRGVKLLGKTAKGAAIASRLGSTTFAQWGKMLGSTRFAKGAAIAYKAVMPKMKRLGIHGLPEEVGEEYIGNAIRAVTIEPDALKEMHKDGNFGAMLIGFAPMTLLGVAGGAATITAVNIQAAKYGDRMREMLGDHYNSQQVEHMVGGIVGAESPEQMQDAIDPMIEAIKNAQKQGKISQKQAEAEIKSIYDYSEWVAKNKALMFAKQTRDAELAQEKKTQIESQYGKFWKDGAEGVQTVQVATLNDGRTVFVTSEPAADGKITVVDTKTGEGNFANVADIATEEVDGKTQQKSQTYTMDAYINGEIANERKTREQARMEDERNAQIDALKSGITKGTKINLGTEGAPVEVVATGKTSNAGVEVVAATGETMTIGWEQTADALGKPIIVKTNKQIIDEQAAEIVQREAERRARRQPKSATTQVSEQTAAETSSAVAEEERHIPMLPDGTVNESAFWQQDPEGYAKWNDEQNQDGGADTREQIAAEMSELEAMLKEQQKAQQTSNPAARKEAKLRAGVIMKRMMRLNSLATQYEIGENRKKWENVIGARIVHIDNLEDLRRLGGEEAITASHNGARVRGFYKGGQAYMYIPGLVQSEEYDEVFIHEVLAHYGLRQMLGKDFEWVLQQVWSMMPEEARQRFMNYPGVAGIEDIQKRQLAAADEYIAHIAEKMEAGQFMEAEEKSIWQKIVEWVKSWFVKKGVEENVMPEEYVENLIRQSYSFLAERKGEELAPIVEQGRTALSAVEQEYETLAQDLTPEEIKAVASNEFNASQNAYNSLVASEPTVGEGESAKDFIARKKAYREQVEAAKAELEAKQALMEEIAKREEPAQPKVEEITEETPAEESTRFSIVSLSEAAGLRFGKLGSATIFRDANGDIVEAVTPDMVRNSKLGGLIQASVNNGFIAEEDAVKQYQFFSDLFTMMQNVQDVDLVWATSGAIGFQPIQPGDLDENGMYVPKRADEQQKFAAITGNSDKQYAKTIDFTTICLKTQAVIDVMSKTMVQLGRGLTREEIIDIVYNETHKAGEPVPCPVCYVFSRWVGLGGLLGKMKRLQQQYGQMSDEEVKAKIAELEAEVKRRRQVTEGDFSSEDLAKVTGELSNKQTQLKDMLTLLYSGNTTLTTDQYYDLIDNIVAELGAERDQRLILGTRLASGLQETLDALEAELDLYNEYSWLKRVRLHPDYKEQGEVPDDILFDINRGLDFAVDYPVAWAYRTTRGPSLGKAAAPYSPLKVGQVVTGIAGSVDAAKEDAKNPFLDPNATDKDRQETIIKAIHKARVQNLRNGQRWQSTSDFRFEYVLDVLMAMLEMQAIGSKVQLYTKVPEAVPLFASLGAEVNCSLMPLGDGLRDGELVFSPITGMDGRDARMLYERYDNVQPIMVGISEAHIRACMRTHWITFIIPYHASGGTQESYISMMETVEEAVKDRTDYSDVQSDRVMPKPTEEQQAVRDVRAAILSGGYLAKNPTKAEKEVMRRVPFLETMYERFYAKSIDGKQLEKQADFFHAFYSAGDAKLGGMAIMPFEYWDFDSVYKETYEEGEIPASVNGKRFMEYCAALGVTPRFSGYNDKGAYNESKDFTNEEGYWKVLIDRSMYNKDGSYHIQKPINITDVDSSYFADKDGNVLPSKMSGEEAAKVLYEARTEGQGIVNPSKLNDPTKVGEITERVLERIAEEERTWKPEGEMSAFVRGIEKTNKAAYTKLQEKTVKAEKKVDAAKEKVDMALSQMLAIDATIKSGTLSGKQRVQKEAQLAKAKTALQESYEKYDAAVAARDELAKELDYNYGKDITRMFEIQEGKAALSEEATAAMGATRFSVIGEVGALRDKTKEGMVRLENLEVARQMEQELQPDWTAKENEAALKIKVATGWERGADGLWRYEVEDIKMKPIMDWLLSKKKLKLGDIVEDGELLRLYPDLADITIVKMKGKYDLGAAYIHSKNQIELPFGALKDDYDDGLYWGGWGIAQFEKHAKTMYMDLIHEVQHAIQRREGFARGGSESTINPKFEQQYNALTQQMITIANEYNAMSRAEQNAPRGASLYQDYNSLMRRRRQYLLGESGYRRLAGEAEARNAEARQDMSMEERRQTLLASTEDVARKDMIFIMNSIEEAESAVRFSVFEPHKSSMDEIDELFREYNSDEAMAALYDKVSALARTMDLKIRFDHPWSDAAGSTFGDKVKFNTEFFNSLTYMPQDKARGLLHEMIHAVTQYAIFAKNTKQITPGMKEAVKQLEDVYEEIKNDSLFAGTYGAKSVHEMVAELANPEFRDRLKAKSLYQRIVDAIKKLLGIEVGDNALDNVSATLDYMIDNYDGTLFNAVVNALGQNESYVRFSVRTDEQRDQLFDAAKKQFGTTDNFKVAGYMLPDGSLLDFSEEGAPANQRTLDHREIESIIMDEGKEYEHRWQYLADFINEGAIRLLPEYAGINLMHAPTEEQRKRLFDFIYKYNGEVILEIADERLNNVAYVEYGRRTSPSRIFRDIDGYFNEGIVPQQDIRFSVANESQSIFVSNAAKAVEGIKMEKATPAQWLAMIEKNGGLKAGEDKWMGLSDWLKASDKKTLTKQEVLDFIGEHMIPVTEEMKESVMEGQVMFSAITPHQSSLAEVSNMFSEWNKEEDLVPLMEKALKVAEEFGVQVRFASDEEMSGIFGQAWSTKVRFNADIFNWADEQDKARCILHELVHSASEYVMSADEADLLDNQIEARREIEAIYEEVKSKFSKEYGAKSAIEMVAEMANPRFRAMLKEGTAWERFVNAIRRILGLEEKDYDRLTPTLDALERILETPDTWLKDVMTPTSEEYLRFSAVSITPEVREEMDRIAANAIIDGNYMLAPNGQPTKLTADQWAMVRTKNFINWFGDWINDPENASKVVDENGEPRVIYHGSRTGANITEFVTPSFFSDDFATADMFKREAETILSINGEKLILGDRDADWLIETITGGGYELNTIYGWGNLGRIIDDASEEEREDIESALFNIGVEVSLAEIEDMRFLPVPDVYQCFVNMRNPVEIDFEGKTWGDKGTVEIEEKARSAKERGYDGVIVKNIREGGWNGELRNGEEPPISTDYIPAFPNQIKSATETTGEFSESGDIRFSANFANPMDSQGNTLSPEQREFFANSKAVDKEGNLLALYHGTPRAGFTEFKSGWFTTSKEDAISYSGDRKGRMFDPNEEYVPETLTAGDFRLGYMTFDSEEDRTAFLERFPASETAMSEHDFEIARMGAEDAEYDALTARRGELKQIWDAYREYERDRFVDTTVGEILESPNAYTEDDLRRAMLAYDSNVVFDSIDEIEDAQERKDALISALNNANEETEGGILDLNVETRVPRNGEGIKHNDLGRRTYEVYANLENPYEIDAAGRHSEFESGDIYEAVREALANEEYDGVIIRNWRVGRYQQLGDVVVPKRGDQIKLTSNITPSESEDVRFSATTDSNEASGTRFSVRSNPAPKKTGIGYKVFYLKDGKLYPPMVANLGGVDTPVLIWLDADAAPIAGQSKTGRTQVKAGGKGTQGGSGTLAYRPGWHLGEIPYALQFNRKDENGEKTLFPANFVWAEVEYADDVDYQEEAMSYGMNANGKFQHSLAGLPKVPTDGAYRYRTNPNPETDPWIITGAMRVKRLLTPSEVDQMVIAAGRQPQKRQEGAVTDEQINALNESLGLSASESGTRFSTVYDPIKVKAAQALSRLDAIGMDFEDQLNAVRDETDAVRRSLRRLKAEDKDEAQSRLVVLEAQEEMLRGVKEQMLDTDPVSPDYDRYLSAREPQSIEEYLADLFTMRMTPVTVTTVVGPDGKKKTVRQGGKKNGIMLTPETLMRELGYSKSDWEGIKYIVSENGMSLDAIAEMIYEDGGNNWMFLDMDTMQIKDEIINFLQGVSTYAEIRDYIENERRLMAEEEADIVSGEKYAYAESYARSQGMSVEEYNEWIIQQARDVREKWLEAAENPEEFAKFEQSNNGEYEQINKDNAAEERGEEEGARAEESEGASGAADTDRAGDVSSSDDAETPEDLPGEPDGDLPGDDGGPRNGGGQPRGNDRGDEEGDSGAAVVPDDVETSDRGEIILPDDFDEVDRGVDEIVEEGKQKAEKATADFMDAIFAINGKLSDLRKAAAAQRKYDQETIQIVTSLANELLEKGKLSDLTRGEIKRLVAALRDSVGRRDLSVTFDRLMNLLITNQLRLAKDRFEEFLKIKGSKVDSRGVEVKGKLDVEGQKMMNALRDGLKLDAAKLAERIAAAQDKLSSESETERRNAEIDLVGYEFARQYLEDVKASEAEESDLRQELKDAKTAYDEGKMSKEAYRELKKEIYGAIRENRMARVQAYESLLDKMSEQIKNSIAGAVRMREAEKARVERIHHFANSDMQGMPASAHEEKKNWFLNNPVVRFLLKPFATFDQMLRSFAPKSRNGEGYLWNHFMGGWISAAEKEYKGIQKAHEILDAKVRELFGSSARRWSDLFSVEKRMPMGEVTFWDEGMKTREIPQGNLLYIYMVNKMSDGKMKLRSMGITEEDVTAIVDALDPRFIKLADWLQEEFLPSMRDKYNAVHERLFGAPMAAIENYFPIRVLAGARTQKVDIGVGETDAKPSTITGSVIKRTKNALALDILNSDAFDVVLGHIEEMEHWAAFAEWIQDLNTLMSYNKFRNRLNNMSGIYGAGKAVWSNFRAVAEIAAGVYKPAAKFDSIDKTAVNISKGVTGSKITWRVFTAFKQLLSWPAFLADANWGILAKNFANPASAWKWSMENLPLFEKRWKSRQAGDSRLMETDADWKAWKNKVVEMSSRAGLTPNAFIDALTVAIGARSVYETRLKEYLKQGYSQTDAEAKAKRDATVSFNESQQSNEAAFLSQTQVDRTVASVIFTAFRNSSMGYQRQYVDALRNIAHMMKKGYKEQSIEYMRKQMMRDGLSEEDATKAANRIYDRSFTGNALKAIVFGSVVQFAWNLGPALVYMLLGDDDDEKKAMATDAAVRALVGGPVEGMSGGPVLSEILGNIAMGDSALSVNGVQLPAVSDLENIKKLMEYDKVRAANEVFNLFVSSGFSSNPQTFVDIAVAIIDAANGDLETSTEITLALLRTFQVPQSQIEKLYMDEIDMTADEAFDMTVEEFAQRYAKYKLMRNAGVFTPFYSDEKKQEQMDKYIKQFTMKVEEARRTRGSELAQEFFEYYDNGYEETKATISDLIKQMEDADLNNTKAEADSLVRELKAYEKTKGYKDYTKLAGPIREYEGYKKLLKAVDNPETKKKYAEEMVKAMEKMVRIKNEIDSKEQ